MTPSLPPLTLLSHLRAALIDTHQMVIVHDLASDMLHCLGNTALLGLPPLMPFQALLSTLPPHDRAEMEQAVQTVQQRSGVHSVIQSRWVGGRQFWLRFTLHHQPGPGATEGGEAGQHPTEPGEPGAAGVITVTVQNLIGDQQAELALAESEAKLRAVVDHTADSVTIKDREGRFLLVNPTAARALGRAPEALLGQTDDFLPLDDERRALMRRTDEAIMASGEARTYEVQWPLGEGAEQKIVTASISEFPYWHRGRIEGTVCIAHDVSEQKALETRLRELTQELEARVAARTAELTTRTEELTALTHRLRYAACHDELTGLPNRQHFMERLQQHVEQRQRNPQRPFAVLFLDFDHFKIVNDSLGHAAGDELLRQIARRLHLNVPGGALVGRFGGDEFMVLLTPPAEPLPARAPQDPGTVPGAVAAPSAPLPEPDAAWIAHVCEQLNALFRVPFPVCGRELQITVSVGATSSELPSGGAQYRLADDAVRDADIAMYRAKGRSRGGAALFEPRMREQQVQRLDLQNDLGKALRSGELRLRYQPIVALGGERGGQVSGVEALVRWQHPQHGLIAPAEFIGVAEERGLIREVDLWVLRHACTELMTLPGEPRALGVNFSARHFEQPGFAGHVGRILAETGFPAHRLIVEITEGLLLSDDALVHETLCQLRQRGMQVAIDDFGTGYSALSYIRRFPLDIVKVDRAFVSEVARDPAIVRSIVQMARSLGLRVVAEGVETGEQQAALRALGCDYVQGYLHARPLCLNDLRTWLEQRQAGLGVDA